MGTIITSVAKCNVKQSHRDRHGNIRVYHTKMWRAIGFDTETGKMVAKHIKGIDILLYKLRCQKLKTFTCDVCGKKYRSNKKTQHCIT